MSMENPYEFLDFDLDESKKAEQQLSEVRKRLDRDGRICICGHPVGRHNVYSTFIDCKPAKMQCPCVNIRPVLEAEDARDFLRKTVGPGPLHALGRGILSASEKNHSVRWLVAMVCDKCGTAGPVSPTSVTQQGIITYEPTGFDVLLCKTCREGS